MDSTERTIDVHATVGSGFKFPGEYYLELTLGETTVQTNPSPKAENPVWDEHFEFRVPPAIPDEHLKLLIKAKEHSITSALPLMHDSTFANGSYNLSDLFVLGTEDARVVLKSPSSGEEVGVVTIILKTVDTSTEKIQSAAGTVLTDTIAHHPPEGEAAKGAAGPGVLPTVKASPTSILGAVTHGLEDPSSPTFGAMQ